MRLPDAPVRRATARVQVLAVDEHGARRRPDQLVTEEPLEIRVHAPGRDPEPLLVTMRTPGNDFELAAGLCITEGVVRDLDDIDQVAYCLGGEGEQLYNVVTVHVRVPVPDYIHGRRFLANASCGICGKATLDDIALWCAPVAEGTRVHVDTITALPRTLAANQRLFDRTGGLHAAARVGIDGALRTVREDVGRHNALDKLIGHALLEHQLPLSDEIVFVSGRLSFELVQKAAVAGVPIVCAVSAPSSLAVSAAERFGQTVVGFVREGRCNVYTHPERVEYGT
jgi:FdhD protein